MFQSSEKRTKVCHSKEKNDSIEHIWICRAFSLSLVKEQYRIFFLSMVNIRSNIKSNHILFCLTCCCCCWKKPNAATLPPAILYHHLVRSSTCSFLFGFFIIIIIIIIIIIVWYILWFIHHRRHCPYCVPCAIVRRFRPFPRPCWIRRVWILCPPSIRYRPRYHWRSSSSSSSSLFCRSLIRRNARIAAASMVPRRARRRAGPCRPPPDRVRIENVVPSSLSSWPWRCRCRNCCCSYWDDYY